MRSIQSRYRNLGIQTAQQSAKQIVRHVSDRSSLSALGCACIGYCTRMWLHLRVAVGHGPTATCVVTTHVTGGASGAMASVGSRRRAMCRLAAR
jgi:hypothetical protein